MLGCHQHALHQSAGKIMGTCLGSKRIRPQRQRPGKRLQLQTVAVGWVRQAVTHALSLCVSASAHFDDPGTAV